MKGATFDVAGGLAELLLREGGDDGGCHFAGVNRCDRSMCGGGRAKVEVSVEEWFVCVRICTAEKLRSPSLRSRVSQVVEEVCVRKNQETSVAKRRAGGWSLLS
jgi:hypothetical protein